MDSVLFYLGTDIHTIRDCGGTRHTCDDGTVKAHTGEDNTTRLKNKW